MLECLCLLCSWQSKMLRQLMRRLDHNLWLCYKQSFIHMMSLTEWSQLPLMTVSASGQATPATHCVCPASCCWGSSECTGAELACADMSEALCFFLGMDSAAGSAATCFASSTTDCPA